MWSLGQSAGSPSDTCACPVRSYGVIYAIAPETFPTPHRGTGDALAGGFQRLCGAAAPLIAVYSAAADTPNGPVYASAAIFIVAGLAMLALPIETRGRTT